MKSISTYIQIAALAACFAAQFHPATVTGMPGTRKALQTLEAVQHMPADRRRRSPGLTSANPDFVREAGDCRVAAFIDMLPTLCLRSGARSRPLRVCKNASPQALARLRTRRM